MKQHYNYILWLFSFFLHQPITAKVQNLTTSVIIPCHYKHVVHLYNLLKCYETQTVLPDEIVISISEIDQAPKDLIAKLKAEPWLFPVKYVESKKQAYAGKNRNAACEIATGDIFICQDADDLPHYRRVEIIKFFFSTYNIDHLMHCYSGFKSTFKDHLLATIPLEKIKFIQPKKYNDSQKIPVHNGNVAIRRHVFDKIKWEDRSLGDEDIRFNQKIYKGLFKNIVVIAQLINYRIHLSQFAELNHKK